LGFNPRGNATSGGLEMSYFDDSGSLQKHRQSWERMHKRGAAFFVLVIGALGCGVLPFVLITCWDALVEHEQMDAYVVALQALFWLLDGIFWGSVTWHFGESRYLRATKQQKLPRQVSVDRPIELATRHTKWQPPKSLPLTPSAKSAPAGRRMRRCPSRNLRGERVFAL